MYFSFQSKFKRSLVRKYFGIKSNDDDNVWKHICITLKDNIEITPKWLLDLGVRWDKSETEMETNGDWRKSFKWSRLFNYQAGITFKPVENGSIYASYATSANPVGVDLGDGSEAISATLNNLGSWRS